MHGQWQLDQHRQLLVGQIWFEPDDDKPVLWLDQRWPATLGPVGDGSDWWRLSVVLMSYVRPWSLTAAQACALAPELTAWIEAQTIN